MWSFCYRNKGRQTVETIENSFATREGHGSVERWSEVTKALLESTQKHLQSKLKKQSTWMSDKTIETIETKQRAFVKHKNSEKLQGGGRSTGRVRRAVKEGK